VGLRRRAIVSVSDTDTRPVVEPGSRTGFVGEPSRRRRDHKRRGQHSLGDHIARTRRIAAKRAACEYANQRKTPRPHAELLASDRGRGQRSISCNCCGAAVDRQDHDWQMQRMRRTGRLRCDVCGGTGKIKAETKQTATSLAAPIPCELHLCAIGLTRPRSPGAPISLRSMRFFTSILCLSVWGATLVAWQRYINHGNAFP
jgi:hypothetical protein